MTCSFEGCDKPVGPGGKRDHLCHAHYAQKLRGMEMKPLIQRLPKGQGKPRKPSVAPEVRAWARANGIDVPARGRIPWQVMEDWRQQNPRN